MVIDSGKLVEYDSPEVLISNKNSKFYELYKKSQF